MIKRIAMVFCACMMFVTACGENDDGAGAGEGMNGGQAETNDAAENENMNDGQESDEQVRKDEIKALMTEAVKDGTTGIRISEIRVNEHFGTETEGGYLVLADLVWEVKNRASTTKEMLEMYNNQIGVRVSELEDVHELTLFWEVPYLAEGENIAKANLIREGENMYFSEQWFNGHIFD